MINAIVSTLNVKRLGTADLQALGDPPSRQNATSYNLLPKYYYETDFSKKNFPKRPIQRSLVTVGNVNFVTDDAVLLKLMLLAIAPDPNSLDQKTYNWYDQHPSDKLLVIIDTIYATEKANSYIQIKDDQGLLTSSQEIVIYINIGPTKSMVDSICSICRHILKHDIRVMDDKDKAVYLDNGRPVTIADKLNTFDQTGGEYAKNIRKYLTDY